MKSFFMILTLLIFNQSFAQTNSDPLSRNINTVEMEPDYPEDFFNDKEELSEESVSEIFSEILSPELQLERSMRSDFASTTWDECFNAVTGNYDSFSCSRRREIAKIFKGYLLDEIFQCVDTALESKGYAAAERIHIEHRGIACDGNHNSRSLHCHLRAIDMKVLKIDLVNGQYAQFTYSKIGNREFYEKLRDCWGRAVVEGNQCPVRGQYSRTASIGWEDSKHGRHMHLSLPVCHAGKHLGNYFVK